MIWHAMAAIPALLRVQVSLWVAINRSCGKDDRASSAPARMTCSLGQGPRLR